MTGLNLSNLISSREDLQSPKASIVLGHRVVVKSSLGLFCPHTPATKLSWFRSQTSKSA